MKNKIFLHKLIHTANRKKKFGSSEELRGKIGGCFSVKKMFKNRLERRKNAREEEEAVFEREYEG